MGCFSVQKLYGREPGTAEVVTDMFHAVLAKYPADKVIMAMQTWVERSQEFPTPADIISLIKRNGKAPITEAMYVAANRKDGADRTGEDWEIIREFEADRLTGWDDYKPEPDHYRELQAEITRLRHENAALWDEKERAWGEVRKCRAGLDLMPKPTLSEKVQRTVDAMKAAGSPQADIDEFLAGVA